MCCAPTPLLETRSAAFAGDPRGEGTPGVAPIAPEPRFACAKCGIKVHSAKDAAAPG